MEGHSLWWTTDKLEVLTLHLFIYWYCEWTCKQPIFGSYQLIHLVYSFLPYFTQKRDNFTVFLLI